MAENAASTAFSAHDLLAAVTSISTNVPSSACARRMLAEVAGMIGQHLLHALGQVGRRQGRTGDVADIGVDPNLVRVALADELREPVRVVHLAAVGLPV